MKEKDSLHPFLKWAGGKRQLIDRIRAELPEEFDTYFEPFVGGGALLFALKPEKAVINDVNEDLQNCYSVIRDDLPKLVSELAKHKKKHSKEYFYEVRDIDLSKGYKRMSKVKKAARIMYLNRTCYNGLYRVNSKGHFNVPFGRYKNPAILNEELLKAVNEYLTNNDVELLNVDFEKAVEKAKKGDFVYFDPPYDPLSETSSFTSYARYKFGKEEQVRLRDLFIELNKRGCRVMLSNSATDFIKELYKDFRVEIVQATRNINSVGSGRGKINEVLVMNYERGD